MVQTYTYEQLSRAFKTYLFKHLDDDNEEVSIIIETIELIMPNTLNDYFGTQLQSIYELQDAGEVDDYLRKMQADTMLKNIDRSEENRYSNAMKWYRRFVKALNSGVTPVPVPGEYQVPSEEQHPSMVAEKEYLPKQQTTIFTEGEDDGTVTSEHRKRNMELRQACIEIFKAKHGGRIVCECCGFDFKLAYDIEDEYIEVHHRFPFAHTEGAHLVNAETDLVPLCANCHRMIHHGQGGKGKCMSLEELKSKLNK